MIDIGDRYIGRQVAIIRARRGITQQVLADRVGVSRSKIAKYETGERPIDSRKLLYALATALQVSVADLTGSEDDKHLSSAAAFHSAAPRIEAALIAEGHTDDQERPCASVAALSRDADRALDLRMAGDLTTLGGMLPDLITDCYRRSTDGPEDDRRAALSALSRAAFATALASKGLGHTSLAWTAARVTANAAGAIGDRVALAASEFVGSQVLLAVPGSVAAALNRSVTASDSLQSDLTATTEGSELYGMLHLQSALTSAALGKDASGHLAEAREMATRTGEQGKSAFALDFGPANVGIWSMSVALEADRGGEALELAAAVDPSAISTAERRSRFYIEQGRAYAMEGRYPEAMTALLQAEHMAPQYVRSRSVVRELVGYMMRRARRDLASGELGRLAQRVGAVPGKVAS
ncbi:helix-turn-helix domain-containing protein [Nocardia sp. 2YAB30]|uniref:helix-turn-helix domain-containing protein n=1 Tax=Nocardia sp. 2YAB30 TaxID=3233022 RepID=UPI003F998F9B